MKVDYFNPNYFGFGNKTGSKSCFFVLSETLFNNEIFGSNRSGFGERMGTVSKRVSISFKSKEKIFRRIP